MIKNLFALEPGECVVAERIKEKCKSVKIEAHIFFPERDVGVDLIVCGDLSKAERKAITIQVKESRAYDYKGKDPTKPTSWHQVRRSKLKDGGNKIDFFIFVTYVPKFKGTKPVFFNEFIVIPTKDLIEKCNNKKESQGKYSFYFTFELDKVGKVTSVQDTREEPAVDFTNYHNRWSLLVEELQK